MELFNSQRERWVCFPRNAHSPRTLLYSKPKKGFNFPSFHTPPYSASLFFGGKKKFLGNCKFFFTKNSHLIIYCAKIFLYLGCFQRFWYSKNIHSFNLWLFYSWGIACWRWRWWHFEGTITTILQSSISIFVKSTKMVIDVSSYNRLSPLIDD